MATTVKDSELEMVELKERRATATPSDKRMTPAAGCFGYTQPSKKSSPYEISDFSVFAALFTQSI
jgi:hypothetical protein